MQWSSLAATSPYRTAVSVQEALAAGNVGDASAGIEELIDALTRSISPAFSAKPAMMSSARLPSVAFNRPPTVGPVRAASSSVAWPRSADNGMIESALRPKTTSGDQWSHSAARANGMAARSQFNLLMADLEPETWNLEPYRTLSAIIPAEIAYAFEQL